MNTQSIKSGSRFPMESSFIALSETSDSYLMKVDLPSLPQGLGAGPIYAGKNDVVVQSNASPLVSIHTQGGKLRAMYQQGALYIVLPKSA